MCTGFTFCQARPRRPAAYGASSALTMTPSCPASSASLQQRGGLARSTGARRRASGAHRPPAPAPSSRRDSGSSIRSTPSRCRQSKKNGRSSSSCSSAPNRLAVSWNGRGRPSSCSASVSPSSTTLRHGRPRTSSTSSGTRVGHLAQRAGPHPDRVAVAVDLDAGAVQLELHGHLGAQLGERGVQALGRGSPASAGPGGRPREPPPPRRDAAGQRASGRSRAAGRRA